MTNNVVNIADFRRPETTSPEQYPTPDELAAMPYYAVLDWAGSSFDRLVAVAEARDYRPEWIIHQLAEHGRQLTGPQDALMARMIADAGPFISRRQRWIFRQIQTRPLSETKLVAKAADAAEYRDLKHIGLCNNDRYLSPNVAS